MNKIKRVSFFFKMLFQIMFIGLPIVMVIAWMKVPEPLYLLGVSGGFEFSVIPQGTPILHTLSATTRILGFLISMIPTGVELFVLYFLIKLFQLYQQGEIFSIHNVKYIRNIGYTLLIGQLLHPIYEGLITATLTWGNPHGHRIATITVGSTNVGILLLALLVILISWIMAEGCQLREEQQLTI